MPASPPTRWNSSSKRTKPTTRRKSKKPPKAPLPSYLFPLTSHLFPPTSYLLPLPSYLIKLSLTGGIGSGKSYVCRLLQLRGIEVFNCDIIAKTIIATHREVRDELCALVGVEELTKQALGDYIRRGPDYAARVNAIVHPRVAEAFVSSGMDWMECAILFESGFDRLVDRVVVVTCPEDERIRRITERDHCDAATARRWLALQMSDEERLQRADFHIVNDGVTPLAPQIDALLAALQ